MSTAKLADPEWRHERATKAALARTTLDYHIQQVINRAPALSDELVEELRQLLLPPAAPSDSRGVK